MKDRNRLTLRLAAISLAILSLTVFAAAQEFQPGAPADKIHSMVNIDEPGRIPYAIGAFGHCNGVVCHATFLPIPAGHRLVVTHVTGNLSSLDPVPDGTQVLISMSNGGTEYMSVPVTPFIPGVFVGGFDQPVLFYFDGGQTPTVQANIGVSGLGIFNPALIGYELDCTKVTCAPIAGAN